jgi:hypothetical protein
MYVRTRWPPSKSEIVRFLSDCLAANFVSVGKARCTAPVSAVYILDWNTRPSPSRVFQAIAHFLPGPEGGDVLFRHIDGCAASWVTPDARVAVFDGE